MHSIVLSLFEDNRNSIQVVAFDALYKKTTMVAETWRRLWGDGPTFRMTFLRKKCLFWRRKFL